MEACSYLCICFLQMGESTHSLFRCFTCLWCRTWPGVSFGLGSEVFFLFIRIILCSGLTIALSLVASLCCLKSPFHSTTQAGNETAQQTEWRGCARKTVREDRSLFVILLYSLPNNHCWRCSETDFGLHKPLPDLP